MLFIVATNVVASQLPERQPTGKPTARAKSFVDCVKYFTLLAEMGRLARRLTERCKDRLAGRQQGRWADKFENMWAGRWFGKWTGSFEGKLASGWAGRYITAWSR